MYVRNLAIFCLVLILAGTGAGDAAEIGQKSGAWVSAWTASPHHQTGDMKPLADATVRSYAHVVIGGGSVRVRVSNEYGSRPLFIGAATVGVVGPAGQVRPDSMRRLTFGGSMSLSVPAAAPALADPVDVEVQAGDTLAVSLYLPHEVVPETFHRWLPGADDPKDGLPPAQVMQGGDFTQHPALSQAVASGHLFVTRVDVLQPRREGLVAVMGTTRTEGPGRWPELLAPRLQASGRLFSVVNASMVANPLTRPYPNGGDAGLARFDRDVLGLSGLTHVIVADAINDIGQVGSVVNGRVMVDPADGPTLEQLQAAYLQLATRTRAHGAKIIVATVMPFEGVPFTGFFNAEKERLRQGLNQWLRDNTRLFDGLVDLDVMVRDPATPSRFLPGLHTANNFSPNAAGERRIAELIDLRLFR